MFRSVLVAIDGSAHARRALEAGADVAERNDASLTVMTVVPDLSVWLLSGELYAANLDFQALAQETEVAYQQLLDDASLPEHLNTRKLLVHGRPGQRIVEEVNKEGHDLVVMGSRGRGEVRSLLLGSVSHHVLNAGVAAVLIVQEEPNGAHEARS